MWKASYVESSAGSHLSAFHALSQMEQVKLPGTDTGKERLATYCPKADEILRWGISERAMKALKCSSTLRNAWGKKSIKGKGLLWPTLAGSQGCEVSKHSLEGSKGDFYPILMWANPVQSYSPRQGNKPSGKPSKHKLRGHKGSTEVPGWGLGFSCCPSSHPPSSKWPDEGGWGGSEDTLRFHRLPELPCGRPWGESGSSQPGPAPRRAPAGSPPAPRRLSPSHNGAASPSSRSPVCRTPL